MVAPRPCCDDCDYETPEEMWDDEADTWMWWYYCKLAEGRRIIGDEGERCPEWCPLMQAKGQENGRSNHRTYTMAEM